MKSFNKIGIIVSVIALLVFAALFVYFSQDEFFVSFGTVKPEFQADAEKNIVKLGYFYGGRTNAIYRSYLNRYFEDEDIDVRFYTQMLREDEWHKVPKDHEKVREITRAITPEEGPTGSIVREFGKVTGVKIIEAMDQGLFAGGTPGESSFIYQVTKGSPLVAVALLGHDDKDRPGKAIVVRKNLTINSPEDFKGKTFISRRAGPGDAIWLKEFLKSVGLDPDKDVTIIDQLRDDQQIGFLVSGKADAALLHMHGVPHVIDGEAGYMYRKMDWMNPELSHALLVFRKDFVEEYPEKVQAVVNAYVKRVAYEDALPQEEKFKPHKAGDFGIEIARHYNGLSLPIFDYPPFVRVDLLEEAQDLLAEYGEIEEKVDINDFVDNSFVERAFKEIEREKNNEHE